MNKPAKVTGTQSVEDVLTEMDKAREQNMRVWNAVCKTDPRHTKPVEFGRKFTAIDAHYQIQEATRQFGPIGEGWGYTTGELAFEDGLVIVPVTLWHGSRDKSFGPIYGSTTLRDRKGNIDKDAPKKATTDALTKALSQLGFNADVFLGRFDDNKYVEELRAEFTPKTGEEPPRKTKLDGPYDTVPKLERAAKEFARTLRGIGSLAEFEEWKRDAEVLAFVEQCKRDLPGWWFPDHPDCPPDFTPLAVEVSSTRRGLTEIAEMEAR